MVIFKLLANNDIFREIKYFQHDAKINKKSVTFAQKSAEKIATNQYYNC